MKLTTIIIGDEILLGQARDTNSTAIARTFCPMGWTVERVITVPDSAAAIREAVEAAMTTSHLVITTGGLGPTKDDITKLTLMKIFGGRLRRDPEVTENIRRVFELRGLQLNPLTADQALVPDTCRVIQNRLGTAPVMWFEKEDHVLVSMPGVPFETEGALPQVARLVHQRFSPDITLLHHTYMVAGITESALASSLSDFEDALPQGIHLAYLPAPGLIRLRLDGAGNSGIAQQFDRACSDLLRLLGPLMVHDGDASPAEMVISRLRGMNLTMATAESCTGGNIARSITAVPGASDVFSGSIVSYANSVKKDLLGVHSDDIDRYGAVSRSVVEQMARGACRATGADCAVATSGIAGPGGGSPDKPVGTVWMAWCVRGDVSSRLARFPGDRTRVIDRATTETLLGLLSKLR